MGFTGFTAKDFQVFATPDFTGRMGAIRQKIQPKLLTLADEMGPDFRRLVGGDIFAHVAKHMRRTVNPPADTWVAFGPDKRGYKPTQHFKIAISRHCVRFLFEIGPEYATKTKWARAWQAHADQLIPALQRAKAMGWFKNEHDEDPAAELKDMSLEQIRDLGKELTRRKDGQLVFGRRVVQGDAIDLASTALEKEALLTFASLLPLYRLV
jgi:uncharacterized protein YktB (UPF0637 family)